MSTAYISRRPPQYHTSRSQSVGSSRNTESVEASEESTISETESLVPVELDGSEVTIPKECTIVLGNKTETVTLGKYLGAGTFGAVYEGIRENGQEVAIKFIKVNEENGVISSEKMASLMSTQNIYDKKIKGVVKCHHNGIVQGVVPNIGVVGYILEKGDFELDNLIDKLHYARNNNLINKKEYFGMVIELWVQLLDAVSSLEKKNILHHDIKPSNIMLFKNKLKLIDVDSAEVLRGNPGEAKSETHTPAYAPPESFRDGWGLPFDAYSTGVILFQIAIGDINWSHVQSSVNHDGLRNDCIDSVKKTFKKAKKAAKNEKVAKETKKIYASILHVCSELLEENPDKRGSASNMRDTIEKQVLYKKYKIEDPKKLDKLMKKIMNIDMTPTESGSSE